MKKTWKVLSLVLSLTLVLSACGSGTSNALTLEEAQKTYLSKVDADYSYALALKMEEIRDNEKLGYRTAGSPSEIATGDMLKAEMEAIGLSDVTKDEFTLDTWTFEKAELSFQKADGTEHIAVMGGYQTEFVTNGFEAFTVIDGGQGTPADLEGLDVVDKFILIDINQRENWWINYPALQAKLLGAKGVIAVQDGGYGEISPDALNTQDICGPADAPAFSLSQTDAKILREAMGEAGEMEIKLDAVSRVGLDGKSYNIMGTIPGKNPDRMIMVSAHYDSYFAGFQDDNAAIALMLGIAKAVKESGYQPENTMVFVAMAAEEWGVSNTRYDWSTGAYNHIFRLHPDWQGKVMANINFELPAMNEGNTDQVRSAYELKTYLESFLPQVPPVEGIFPDGAEVIVPTQTWSDDFSMSIAGIPPVVTSLRGEFAKTHYHSQFDNRETYSKEAFLYHHNQYGMLLMAYDYMLSAPLDFSTRLSAMKDSVDAEIFTKAGVDPQPLRTAMETATTAAGNAWAKVNAVNMEYQQALEAGDAKKAEGLKETYDAMAAEVLSTFRFAEDAFVRLTWEDVSIFPHEHFQNNLAGLYPAIEALESGDTTLAIDEYLWLVDNNFYAYDWSRDVYDYFTDYVLNQPAERLMWGAGRVQGHADLYDVIASLLEKYDTKESVAEEAKILATVAEEQGTSLGTSVEQQILDLQELTKRLEAIAAYE